MKASLNIKAFSKALAIVTRVSSGKANMPVLCSVLLKFYKSSQRVSMVCTDLDSRIETSLVATVKEPGSICVSSTLLSSIINAIPGENVTLSKLGSQIKIESGTSKFSLHTIEAEEFPPAVAATGEIKSISFNQDSLLSRLKSVSPAQCSDPNRYILNSVFLSQGNDAINFVATDGRRLHLNSTEAKSETLASLILPGNLVPNLKPLLGFGKSVTLTISERMVIFNIEREQGDIVMHSKVVEGNYPDYTRVIPKNHDKDTITVNREEFAQTLIRMSLALSEKEKAIRLNFNGQTINVSASSPEVGDATEDLAAQNPNSVSCKLAINPNFVIEALQAATDETVTVKVTDEVSPMILKIGNLLCVIMPVRI